MGTNDVMLEAQARMALERPSYIKAGSEGLEEVTFKDMVLPRLGLCQTNSKARNKNEGAFIKGLEEGQMFNSLTKQIYGESIQIVPLFFYHSRIMFKDMEEGGGIICQAPDGKSCQMNNGGACLHAGWGANGEPPECNEFFNYPSLVYQENEAQARELIIVSLKTTGLKAGRTLNSLMRLRGTPSFAGVYKLSSVADKNQAGMGYYTWDAKNGNPPWVGEDLLNYARTQYKIVFEGLKSGSITVDDSDAAFADHDTEV